MVFVAFSRATPLKKGNWLSKVGKHCGKFAVTAMLVIITDDCVPSVCEVRVRTSCGAFGSKEL